MSIFPSLQLVNSFEDAISGAELLRKHAVDLVFVDINMPRYHWPRPGALAGSRPIAMGIEEIEMEA